MKTDDILKLAEEFPMVDQMMAICRLAGMHVSSFKWGDTPINVWSSMARLESSGACAPRALEGAVEEYRTKHRWAFADKVLAYHELFDDRDTILMMLRFVEIPVSPLGEVMPNGVLWAWALDLGCDGHPGWCAAVAWATAKGAKRS